MLNKENIIEEIFKLYNVEEKEKNVFLLKLDWLLEIAAFPIAESYYNENLEELWNTFMPSYEFNDLILQYSKAIYSAPKMINNPKLVANDLIQRFEICVIKNKIKYLISQNNLNRLQIISETYEELENLSHKKTLYDKIVGIFDSIFLIMK